MHRPEWARRGERIAHAVQHAHSAGVSRHEVLDEARLAHARLARDRRDAAGARDSVTQELVQLRQDRFALEDVHLA